MKATTKQFLSISMAAVSLAMAAACSKGTRHDSSPSAVEPSGTAGIPREQRPTERAGSDTGNTGHGKGRDASSTPITGMSGNATGTPSNASQESKK